MTASRTAHRSTSLLKALDETRLEGEFTDIQTCKRAHGQDVKRTSKAELANKRSKRIEGQ